MDYLFCACSYCSSDADFFCAFLYGEEHGVHDHEAVDDHEEKEKRDEEQLNHSDLFLCLKECCLIIGDGGVSCVEVCFLGDGESLREGFFGKMDAAAGGIFCFRGLCVGKQAAAACGYVECAGGINGVIIPGKMKIPVELQIFLTGFGEIFNDGTDPEGQFSLILRKRKIISDGIFLRRTDRPRVSRADADSEENQEVGADGGRDWVDKKCRCC